MNRSAPPQTFWLTEYAPRRFAPDEISQQAGKILLDHYQRQLDIEFPTPKTAGQWQLTAQGWIGHIPLTPDLHLALQPKVPLVNVFRMLEYAYRLPFEIGDGLIHAQSLAEFYERLAHILARRVLDRNRQGLYRAYLPQTERLPYLRGRLDGRQVGQRPGQVKLDCHYEENTADIEDNQILAWTLYTIARSGMCTERVLPAVRRAYRALQGVVTLRPYQAEACLGRLYNRLNDNYQPMHALCRFFLEQSGPGHQLGDRTMLPFLVDMARLYELFVAEWLTAHLPPHLRLAVQEKIDIGQVHNLYFNIDLVLYEADTGAVRCVLDTKYKAAERPAADDIHQMISYAHTKGCSEAILIYPTPLSHPFDETIRGIRVRSLAFGLGHDLELAGQTFWQTVGIE